MSTVWMDNAEVTISKKLYKKTMAKTVSENFEFFCEYHYRKFDPIRSAPD